MPTYHDLYVTTAEIPRSRLSDLSFGYVVMCTRVSGWTLWLDGKEVASEYEADQRRGLRLDVDGAVICDSLS